MLYNKYYTVLVIHFVVWNVNVDIYYFCLICLMFAHLIRVSTFPGNTGFTQGSGIYRENGIYWDICGNKSIIDITTG